MQPRDEGVAVSEQEPKGDQGSGQAGADARRTRDKDLVEAARGGDGKAFGTLYDHWIDQVYDLSLIHISEPTRPY